MTFKRDIKHDIKLTDHFLSKKELAFSEPSWLGHKGKGCIIDYELLKGATKDQLIQSSGRKKSGVEAHLYHLKNEHGLIISKKEDTFKIEKS